MSREDRIQRIALVGPESCGKSYLAEFLAGHFNTVFVEEYGRTYCEKYGMNLTELDFAHIAGGQLYREDVMAKQANGILFCDTELIVTQIWSEIFFNGVCQPWIIWASRLRHYDMYLLLAPDIPWKDDGLRAFGRQREWMFNRLQAELEDRHLKYEIIRGGYEERTRRAIGAVEGHLNIEQLNGDTG
ncbi:MAG: ATPase [Haliscomenobacteraceae bacterium CHB4]|nr:Trifunctional NAD biosynthesis/regulator protein NadR [Saprospiraceae bacterium]MCE7923932.1 ATPase [Haliscomenobacteraceae bacterium CHB4]